MPIFELTFGRIINLIEAITKFLFATPIEILKSLGFLFSLIITGLLIYFWIKLEIKNKDEIDFWNFIFETERHYQLIREAKNKFKKIKEHFHNNKLQGLIEVNNFLDEILAVCGYEGNLEEKLNKINEKFLPNKEEIKKARQILLLINQKKQANESIELSDDEYLIIFHEYEKGLLSLNIITEEDFLVRNQEQ